MIGNFIVSLASYSKRIKTIDICLDSLFQQVLRPKKILLYLDSSIHSDTIPSNIIPFIDAGLEVNYVSDEIGPHNKYYYTFQKYPDENIITVDDDVIYDKYTFSNLMKTHKNFPDAVCANRVKYMMFDINKNVMSYNNWFSEYEKILYPSKRLVAVGVGGILYPPYTFTNEVFNKENIINLALTADDLWLKIMELRNNVPVVWTGQLPQHPIQIPGTMNSSLWRLVNKSKNDEYIKKMIEYYKLDLFSIVER